MAASFGVFLNFETAPVHPVALAPGGTLLAVCNLPDYRVELFDVSGRVPVALGDVPVGVDPVSVRFRTTNELWVVNHISSSISIVDVAAKRIVATIDTKAGPTDVAFAASPLRAFVSCAKENTVQVFEPVTRQLITNIVIDGERPKAMAVSPDGRKVYVAIFESGNASTLLTGAGYPPNVDGNFSPPLFEHPNAPEGFYVEQSPDSLIVKKNAMGRWMDDNLGDWTEYISGTNAPHHGRPIGWDMPDRDVAVIDTATFEISYATGLMNICMDVAVNPASGQIAVVGTDATNERRFEPNLRGTFIRVNLALVDPTNLSRTVVDLNPHLDYSTASVSASERSKSLGDPRGIIWSSDGTRGYIAGMGSGNLVVIDAQGSRITTQPMPLEEGPTGLALDETRHRLYILNRFAATISVLDATTLTIVTNTSFYDPTPEVIRAGRKHLYDTHRNSGLGQLACASCHVDGRFDRLAWDLGNPALDAQLPTNNVGFFHPMKGPLVTQTLQDIIGQEPLHWRGDRPNIESFNGTFTDLLAREARLTTNEMQQFKDFLATIHFPPNRFRDFDNSLPTNQPLPGLFGVSESGIPDRTPLPNGNAQRGQERFAFIHGCSGCHQNDAGRGAISDDIITFVRREGNRPFKIAQLRSLQDKVGMDRVGTSSRVGFGFRFDGREDSLTRFLVDLFEIKENQEIADLTAFLLTFSGFGSERAEQLLGSPSKDAAAAVGRQVTLTTPSANPLVAAMTGLADQSPTSRVDLIARGVKDGLNRGWFYDAAVKRFLSDRNGEEISGNGLIGLASAEAPLTFTVVAAGIGRRTGIDRDGDGRFDRTELENGSDPTDPCVLDTNLPPEFVHLPELRVHSGALVAVPVLAAYVVEPCQRLRFELAENSPSGTTIHPTTGLFTWPIPNTATGTYTIAIRVHYERTPPHLETNTLTIAVVPLQIQVWRSKFSTTLGWLAIGGSFYRFEYKDRLEDPEWHALGRTFVSPNSQYWSIEADTANELSQRFYRLVSPERPF